MKIQFFLFILLLIILVKSLTSLFSDLKLLFLMKEIGDKKLVRPYTIRNFRKKKLGPSIELSEVEPIQKILKRFKIFDISFKYLFSRTIFILISPFLSIQIEFFLEGKKTTNNPIFFFILIWII